MSSKDSSTAGAGDNETKVTAQDAKFFVALFRNLTKNVEVDWDKFATEMNFKNAGVAKTRYGQIRSKLGLTSLAAGSQSTGGLHTVAGAHITKRHNLPKPKRPVRPRKNVDDAIDSDRAAADAQNGEI